MKNYSNSHKMYKGIGFDNNGNSKPKDDILDIANLGPLATPLSIATAATDNGPFKGSNSAPVLLDTYDLAHVSGPKPMSKASASAAQQQTVVRQQGLVMPYGSLPDFDPASIAMMGDKAMVKSKTAPILAVKDEVFEELEVSPDFSEFKSEPFLCFVPSKCVGSGLQSAPALYNERTSVVVDESPKQVMDKLKLLLTRFSNDIDFKIDEENYVINGQIFIRHFAVFFKISVWSEPKNITETATNTDTDIGNGSGTRFEFRRSDGDSAIFNEFWTEIENEIYKQFTNCHGMRSQNSNVSSDDNDDLLLLSNESLKFEPLDYNLNGLEFDDMAQGQSLNSGSVENDISEELDLFVQDMNESDPNVVYTLAMLLDAFKVQTVLDHSQFIQCLIHSALTHFDTALVRGALVSLERICESEEGAERLIACDVLQNLVPLLQHNCDLIRKYCVRVLSKLVTAKKWRFANAKLRKFAQIMVNENQLKWENCRFATDDFIATQMFERIQKKLITTN